MCIDIRACCRRYVDNRLADWYRIHGPEAAIAQLKTPLGVPWSCPRCGGRGHDANGSGGIGGNQALPQQCYLCKGSGRVSVTPVPA